MVKKGETPNGTKRMNTRPKPEKEEVMKATNTLKALAMVCAAVICLNGYAAAEENALDATMDNGAGYVDEVQGAGLEEGTVITAMAACFVAPWGAAATALTVFTGVGLIADVLIPEKDERPDTYRAMEQVAYKNQDNKAGIDLAANDRD
jgi:hypothetical protein